jgi:hypothetical protein
MPHAGSLLVTTRPRPGDELQTHVRESRQRITIPVPRSISALRGVCTFAIGQSCCFAAATTRAAAIHQCVEVAGGVTSAVTSAQLTEHEDTSCGTLSAQL